MRLLFFDESGSRADRHFVCAGVSVQEQDAFGIADAVDELMNRAEWPFEGSELHTGPLMRGRGRFRAIPVPIRMQLFDEVLGLLLRAASAGKITLHVVVLDNLTDFAVGGEVSGYRRLIADWLRLEHRLDREQACLAVGDTTRLERQIQKSVWMQEAIDRPSVGRSLLLTPPLFVDSRDSRMVQLADFVAYWAYRSYERDDNSTFTKLLPAFALGSLRHETSRTNCECHANH